MFARVSLPTSIRLVKAEDRVDDYTTSKMAEKHISTKHGIMHNAVVFGIGRVVFF